VSNLTMNASVPEIDVLYAPDEAIKESELVEPVM
jgi:hypothetical protein